MSLVVDRESATTEELFDALDIMKARLERAEETVVLVGGMLLHHLGKIKGPEGFEMDEAVAMIADYILLVQQEHAFSNAPE